MGLFDHLFKSKSPPSEEKSVETGAKPAEPAKHSDTAARSTASERPDPSAFLHPKSFVPRGISPLAAAPVKGGAPSGVRKLTPPPPPPPAREEIVLTLGDVLSRIPTPYLKPGNHDPKRELRFGINDLSSDIARGRAAVPLSRIAQIMPDIFVKQISHDEDMEVRLPLQKLVEQIGLLRSGRGKTRQATTLALPGEFALSMADASAPGRETLSGLGVLVEPIFELKSVEAEDLAIPVEEEPTVELKPAAEPLIVQFPLAAGAPEVVTPPDLAEEDVASPEPEVAEPAPSPTKEVATAPRAEETPAKVSESFEALLSRLKSEAAAKFSEESATHAETPPAAAKETTSPKAETMVPTAESTAPPTEHAVDAKPDQPLAEKPAPVTEPPPPRTEAATTDAEPTLPKTEAAPTEAIKPAVEATAAVAEPTVPVAEKAAPSPVPASPLVEAVATSATLTPPPISVATTSPASFTLPPEPSGTAMVAPETVPTVPAAEKAAPVEVSAPSLVEAAAAATSSPPPAAAAITTPASSLPLAESGASAVAPEEVPVAAPAPVGESLPPSVPVAEAISKPEIVPDVPTELSGQRMPPSGRAAVPERPMITTPVVRESAEPAEAGGEKIQLSLAAILRQCPREIIVGEMPHVPDSVRITLPFAPIDRQLVQGHVEISAVRFVAAIPFTYQKHFSARMGVKVPIPLEEVFQNLPSAVPDKPAVSGPVGQILAPAFPEENVLAAFERLPPMPEAIELAPAPVDSTVPKTVGPTGMESVLNLLKTELPPPIEKATESPKGVEMPSLESVAEALKSAEPSPIEKAEQTAKPVELAPFEAGKTMEPGSIERTRPVVAEPPPLQRAAETPQGVAMPPIENEAEAPKGVKPPPLERVGEDAKSTEAPHVESATTEPIAPEPPPIESATEAPKAVKPGRIKKTPEGPKAAKPASTKGAPAKPEGVQPPPLESAAVSPQTAEPPPPERVAADRQEAEPQPMESAAAAIPQTEAPQRVEESSSSPVSAETPLATTAPGAPPMEPTAPEPAPAHLDLPAFHQFMPPPPFLVPEAVEPAPIVAIGSAEPIAATPATPHLAPAAAPTEATHVVAGATQPAAAIPAGLVPDSVATASLPVDLTPPTGPEPHKVAGESVPHAASLTPEPPASVLPPEAVVHAANPEIVEPLTASAPPPPAPPVEPAPEPESVSQPAPPEALVEPKKDAPLELKVVEEAPVPVTADPSLSVFAEATQTIRPPQMVRPFIVLPPPIIGFTPPPPVQLETDVQVAENKATETDVTQGSDKTDSVGSGEISPPQELSPESSDVSQQSSAPVELVSRAEEAVVPPGVITADFTRGLVPPVEPVPESQVPIAGVGDVPQGAEPTGQAVAAPVSEVIPPESKEASAVPAVEKPVGGTPPAISFVVQGQFAEPPPPVLPPATEPAPESVPEAEPAVAMAAESAPAAAAAPTVSEPAAHPVEPVTPAPKPAATVVEPPAATTVEPPAPAAPEPPAPIEVEPAKDSETEAPLLHIPQIAAALEAANEMEVLPPPALPLRRFDQDALQALFMTEEMLDLTKISRLAAQLPGVHACVIATRDQACTGGTLPEGFDLAALLGLAPRVNEAAGRMPIGNLKHFTLYGERYSISFFARNGLSLCAVHRPRSFVPGVREKLVAIADELSK